MTSVTQPNIPFPDAARDELANEQLRRNLRGATDTITAKRNRVAGELPDWEELRARPRGSSGRRCAGSTRTSCSSRSASRPRAGSCTGRPTPRRRARS